MKVALLDLGRRPYSEVWEIQKSLMEERSQNETLDTLILVEHEHVITLGRKTSPENLGPQEIPVFKVERGGDATYHGPGQLVGYPIVSLQDHDVRKFVRSLEEVLILAANSFSIPAERVDGHPGVWVHGKKLASIGVAVTNWVTYHGFALNVNPQMDYFQLIRPCGLDPGTMISMQMLLGVSPSMGAVKAEVERNFAQVFGAEFAESAPPSESWESRLMTKIK